jgi:penicillin amidase
MRWKKVLRRGAQGLLVLLVLVTAVAVWHWFRWSGSGAPLREGTVALAGLEAPVTVRWDRWAVPMVEAESGRDAAFALGWIHANDRLTQMELGRRAAAGRLAEVAGRPALPMDLNARQLRLRDAAETLWANAGDEARLWLEAYAAGVNSWIGARTAADDLPPGLRLLGVEPEPWHPVDSLGFAVLMARDLSFWAGRPEEERLRWLDAFGEARTWELIEPLDESDRPEIEARSEDASESPSPPGRGPDPSTGEGGEGAGAPSEDGPLGSNNWILGGSWTASGAPLLANDPHLPLRLPGTWYQVLLRAPEYEVMGMTIPGLPGVVIGRNGHLAWALTNTMLDDHDLFLEEVDDSGTRVRRGEGWVEITTEMVEIPIKGEAPHPLTLRSTDHGPLLEAQDGLPARSLAWTAYLPADPLGGFLGLARATTTEAAQAAVASYAVPSQNLVVAAADGPLRYVMLGRAPQRRTDDGRLALPAADPAHGWDGLAPVADNLVIVDPDEDLLITANHDVRPEGWEGTLIADFDTSHRAERIHQRLTVRHDWRPEDFAAVLDDVVSLYALDIVEALAGEYEGEAAEAFALLSRWDGAMEATGPAALFALFERELRQRAFGDEARHHGLAPFDSRDRILGLLQGQLDPAWFDDVTTEGVEDRATLIAAALQTAWQQAETRWGKDPTTWSYGDLHPLHLRHPLGGVPLLGRFYNRGPWPQPGSATTVAAFGGGWRGEQAPVHYGPSMRWVTDAADADQTLAVLPGGQSGHPFDPHYDDQLPLYRSGQLRAVAWTPEAVEAATLKTLTLQPEAQP